MEILGYKCRKCGNLHYPYRMVCKKCGDNEHNEFDAVPLPRAGKLVAYTFLHNPPADYMVVKLPLGIVELENGIRVTGQLKIDSPKSGLAVRGEVEVVRQGAYSKTYGMVFYKA